MQHPSRSFAAEGGGPPLPPCRLARDVQAIFRHNLVLQKRESLALLGPVYGSGSHRKRRMVLGNRHLYLSPGHSWCGWRLLLALSALAALSVVCTANFGEGWTDFCSGMGSLAAGDDKIQHLSHSFGAWGLRFPPQPCRSAPEAQEIFRHNFAFQRNESGALLGPGFGILDWRWAGPTLWVAAPN